MAPRGILVICFFKSKKAEMPVVDFSFFLASLGDVFVISLGLLASFAATKIENWQLSPSIVAQGGGDTWLLTATCQSINGQRARSIQLLCLLL